MGSPSTHKTPTHDDRLLSTTLVAIADQLILENKLHTGTGHSTTIPPYDPLAHLTL